MPGSTHAAAEAAVLGANATFYKAFTDGDYAAMSALWAERAPVTCFHPGGQAVVGRSAVMGTWKQILGGASSFELRCDHPVVRVIARRRCGHRHLLRGQRRRPGAPRGDERLRARRRPLAHGPPSRGPHHEPVAADPGRLAR